MEIKLVTEMGQEASDHLFHWPERVFPVDGDISWAKPKWHLIAYDGHEPCAHLGYADFTVCIDDERLEKVVGVGGVVVRPEHQGRNIPAKLFDYLHTSQHARSISEWMTLFCPKRLETYYQRHGYATFNGGVTFKQNNTVTGSDRFIIMYYGKSLAAHKIHLNGEPW